jgi:hypothetical protein
MKFHYGKVFRAIGVLTGIVFLHACDSNNNAVAVPPPPPPPPPPPAMASYAVTVANLTNAQPLSPVAVIGHQSAYSAFMIGTAASQGLEELAEGGDNSTLLADAAMDAAVLVTGSGAAPIGPAGSETVTVTVQDSQRPGMQISVSTMLVNTNDAFSGLNAVDVEAMVVGDVLTFETVAYDAGTEADTEMAMHIPGPAGGGEGFNAVRDDQGDRVTMHSGIVSNDDGLATSDLTEQHRFDNPVARVRIERTL